MRRQGPLRWFVTVVRIIACTSSLGTRITPIPRAFFAATLQRQESHKETINIRTLLMPQLREVLFHEDADASCTADWRTPWPLPEEPYVPFHPLLFIL